MSEKPIHNQVNHAQVVWQNNIVRIINNLLLLLIFASYFEFFKFSFIPSSIRYLSQFVIPAIMLAFIIIHMIYSPGTRNKMHFSALILIMVISAIPSFLVAYIYHDQTFVMSVWGNRIILFYFLYFYIHFYKISVTYILRLLIGIGLFAVLLYYIQYFLYPKLVLDIYVNESRGTLRMFIPGMICTQFVYFYFLNKFLSTKKLIHLLLSLLSLSIFILQGTRQLILALFFLTLVNLILTKQIRSKLWILILFTIAMVTLFFIFREIFNELTKVSTLQVKNISGGIRIKAAKFYLTTFMPDTLAYIFGNSDAGSGNTYSMRLNFYSIKYGFFISDIGILGDYVKYGIVFTVTGILLLIKSVRFKVSSEYACFKYYIFSQCFTLIAGYGILGGVDVVLLLILYIFDIDRANRKRLADEIKPVNTIRQIEVSPVK